MSGIIYTGTSTHCHELFVNWLNTLLTNYQNGFYDASISNIIRLSFVREHNLFLQELFPENGIGEPKSFITVLPTDTVKPILMVHNITGIPMYYNSEDISNILEFTTDGVLKRFYENVVIPIYDSEDTQTHELFITFVDFYGTKSPMIKLKNIKTGEIEGTGMIDALFEGRYAGSYNVKTTPFEEVSYYNITNITKMVVTADIPVLPNLVIRFKIKSGETIKAIQTEQTDYYIRNGLDLDTFKYKLIEV